jgi:branched-chain amino acid transport system permease protein
LQRENQWLDLNALRMVIYAAVLIALMILRPEGLLGEKELFGRGRSTSEPKGQKPTSGGSAAGDAKARGASEAAA